jgi:hypothetical protein
VGGRDPAFEALSHSARQTAFRAAQWRATIILLAFRTVMSESPTTAEHASHTAEEPLFDRSEVREFEADDREAGVRIGQMLSTLFVYTVIVMAISAYATYAHWMGK